MVILTSYKQLFPVQYGMGLKYYKNIHGGNIFKRFLLPAGNFILNKVIHPFIKNNKDDIKRVISEGSKTVFKNLLMRKDPPNFSDIKQEVKTSVLRPILKNISEKPLIDHLKGAGLSYNKAIMTNKKLNKRSKNIIKIISKDNSNKIIHGSGIKKI